MYTRRTASPTAAITPRRTRNFMRLLPPALYHAPRQGAHALPGLRSAPGYFASVALRAHRRAQHRQLLRDRAQVELDLRELTRQVDHDHEQEADREHEE